MHSTSLSISPMQDLFLFRETGKFSLLYYDHVMLVILPVTATCPDLAQDPGRSRILWYSHSTDDDHWKGRQANQNPSAEFSYYRPGGDDHLFSEPQM